jgi:hypothetical protein
MVDGVGGGGRSTYGLCFGLLGWRVDEGNAEDLDLARTAVALSFRYDDDEPQSPWTLVLYLDDRADEQQRDALENIFLGRSGGSHILKLPWVRKPSEVVAVRRARVELDASNRSLRVVPHSTSSRSS